MKGPGTILIAFLTGTFFLVLSVQDVAAKQTLAFGYLKNNSGNANYDYLETLFPNSFASSIIKTTAYDVKKPLQIQEAIQKSNLDLKNILCDKELPLFAKTAETDFFIYGSFRMLGPNLIRIEINVYNAGSGEIFHFENTGTLKAEIFMLVDQITGTIIKFISTGRYYKSEKFQRGSKIAILSNLSSEALNILYISLLKSGYRITGIQNSELVNMLDIHEFENFKYIKTKTCFIKNLSLSTEIDPCRNPRINKSYQKKITWTKGRVKQHTSSCPESDTAILCKMSDTIDKKMDYLLIIGFTKTRRKCWLRVISLKKQELIWIQPEIISKKMGQPVSDIASTIINFMNK